MVEQRRAPRPAVIESGQAVAEPIQLELPRLYGVAESAYRQNVGPLADLFGPDVEGTGVDVLALMSEGSTDGRMCVLLDSRTTRAASGRKYLFRRCHIRWTSPPCVSGRVSVRIVP